MFLFMVGGFDWDLADTFWQMDQDQRDIAGAVLAPFIAMKTADNKLVPWLASQTDVLAEDWVRA